MALLAKFHHGNFPTERSKQFKELDKGEISDLLRCALMLKIADILDRRHNSSVDTIELSASSDEVTLSVGSESDISMEMWKLKTIENDFKAVFGMGLKIKRS
jgi:exopolyphosphatase/guanosine-5'-triphosphate,3'-diphosphate pyrophosphatase